MSEEKKPGFWASLSELERTQIKLLIQMLALILIFVIIASLIVGSLISIFG